MGREQSIASCRYFDQPITANAIVIRDCSDQGAQRLPAVKVGKRGVFVQQSGRKVYELAFAGQELDYADRDLTRLNLDIGLAGFVDIDKSTQPDKTRSRTSRFCRRPAPRTSSISWCGGSSTASPGASSRSSPRGPIASAAGSTSSSTARSSIRATRCAQDRRFRTLRGRQFGRGAREDRHLPE
jgi:hypothetical protein